MLREKLSEFLTGKVSFNATNGFSELFLSNCKKSGVYLFDITKTELGLSACVKYSDMDLVYSAAEKSGMELEIIKRSGMPHLFFKYRRRFGIPVGLFVGILITSVLSSTVWSVDISGYENIPLETLEELLRDVGIEKGSFGKNINCDDAEAYLENKLEVLSWVSVYRIGSRVFVEVREREEQITGADKLLYSNIIAAKDGEIVKADIFTGEGKFYPGSAVVKGDLLVNGVVTMRDESVKFVNSDARIIARTHNTVNCSAPKEFAALKPVNCKNRYVLYLFGLSLPLAALCKADNFTDNNRFFDSGSVTFPVGIIRENYFSLEETEVLLDDIQTALLAFCDFSKASLEIYANAEIEDSQININYTDSQVFIEARLVCYEDIAEKKYFTVEETQH